MRHVQDRRSLCPLFAAAWLSMLAGLPAAAQQAPGSVSVSEPQPAPAVAVSAESKRRLHVAFDHLYNLDFDPALQIFAEVAEAEPDSAAVSAFWSCALLYEMLAEQGTLQSQLFVTNDFLDKSPPAVDPALEAQYVSVREDAERRAERRLAANPDDVDALFALGLVYGNAANYMAGVKARYFRGLRLGERAHDIHSRLREMRPDIHDTGVVLGVREYVIGTLPRAHRFMVLFVGARGDRELGLEYMRDAVAHGEFLGPYAQVLLAMASIREGDLAAATSLAEDLADRYPRNPLVRLELLKLYREQQRYEDAQRLARSLLGDLTADPPTDSVLERVRADVMRELESIGGTARQ